MAKRNDSNKGLIKCEYCGEMYSVTYKHCPFCNGDGTGRWDEYEKLPPEKRAEEEENMNRSGKRVAGGAGTPFKSGRGGPSLGRIIAILVSLALIIAAVCIVVSIVRSIVSGGQEPVEPSAPPVESVTPSPTPENSPVPGESAAPAESQTPAATPKPSVQPTVGNPTGFKLNREDFTLGIKGETFQLQAAFTPADSKAAITWKSSDPKIVSVSESGLVTAVAPGMVTLTATAEGLPVQECIVRCNFPADSEGIGSSSAGGLALNREDFTLGRAGETWKLTVSGTSANPVWAVANAGVATVAGDGTVTAVAPGITTVTATVDGVSLTCTVRCRW